MQINTAIDQLWVWLQGKNRTVHKVMVNGQVESVGHTRQEVERAVQNLIGPIVDEIIMSHDWDFACDVTTSTSVIGTSEYTLTGKNSDCRDIIGIRYGSGRGYVLEELNVLQTDRREGESTAGTSDTSNAYGYTLYGRSPDGFPLIQIFDTPTSAETITYRYRKNGLNLNNIPDNFGFVVRDFLRAEFDDRYFAKAADRLNEMIDRYKVGGDSPDVMRIHPEIERGNIRRGGLQGGM